MDPVFLEGRICFFLLAVVWIRIYFFCTVVTAIVFLLCNSSMYWQSTESGFFSGSGQNLDSGIFQGFVERCLVLPSQAPDPLTCVQQYAHRVSKGSRKKRFFYSGLNPSLHSPSSLVVIFFSELFLELQKIWRSDPDQHPVFWRVESGSLFLEAWHRFFLEVRIWIWSRIRFFS